ncbi:PREDICTED: protein PALE CRESS, chloroplastic isoform X2 [Ipomoea nil]|uniref:protein PALE CRESS, chloroplastic isoform X2 n=1 Tax=Ipomoea nil TaxID=35883 RepID=UPI0009010C4C|nr:PREDICTED: protein PALE CRESS, chloroplastic isoform X2 [Ipomoea nil]
MESKALRITCLLPLLPTPRYPPPSLKLSLSFFNSIPLRIKSLPVAAPKRCKTTQEQDLYDGIPPEFFDDDDGDGLPPEFYDDEWQAKQREKTKEFHRLRQQEDEEEEKKVDEYREIAMRLKDYPIEELCKARKLVSSFIRSAEEVEEKIEEAAEKGELTELVLMVIWNRLDLAKRDDEKDAVRSLDLLYRRVEMEILKREATPAMRLLNDLLNMYDGFDDEGWLKKCKKTMVETFPREDPFSILVPAGFDMEKHEGPVRPNLEADDVLLRVDFVREVDALLQEVRGEEIEAVNAQWLDAESVAVRLKKQEKQRAINQVEAILDVAINLKW